MIQDKAVVGLRRQGRPEKYTADEILKTALEMYWTEGVSTLSVNDLVRRMGIPKPSLYRHFASEDALHASVLLAYEGTALANLTEIMQRPATFSRQLEEMTDALIVGIKGHTRGCLLFQMRDAGEALGPAAQDTCEKVFSRFCERVKEWVETAMRRGDVTLKTDSITTTHLFLGLITLIRNGFRDGLDEAGIRVLSRAHVDGFFQLNASEVL